MDRREQERREENSRTARDWANSKGGGFEATSVKLPEGVEAYKLQTGTHKIDFMPYIVGKNNRWADEGKSHFCREYQCHNVPTPTGNQRYTCRKSEFGKPCAVCNWLKSCANPQLIKDMKAKNRILFAVNDKPGSSKNAIKVLDQNMYNRGLGFGEQLQVAMRVLDESIIDPFTLKKGHTAVMQIVEQSGGGFKYNAAQRIDLQRHDYDYSKEVLENAPCLDDCIVDPGYEEVMELLDTGESGDDDSDEDFTPPSKGKSSPKGKAPPKEEEEDEDEMFQDEIDKEDEKAIDDEDEDFVETPLPKSSKNGHKKPDWDDEEDEEEAPKSSPKAKDDFVDDENEEEEAPAPKRKPGRPKSK
jgi:hypothetical protein